MYKTCIKILNTIFSLIIISMHFIKVFNVICFNIYIYIFYLWTSKFFPELNAPTSLFPNLNKGWAMISRRGGAALEKCSPKGGRGRRPQRTRTFLYCGDSQPPRARVPGWAAQNGHFVSSSPSWPSPHRSLAHLTSPPAHPRDHELGEAQHEQAGVLIVPTRSQLH